MQGIGKYICMRQNPYTLAMSVDPRKASFKPGWLGLTSHPPYGGGGSCQVNLVFGKLFLDPPPCQCVSNKIHLPKNEKTPASWFISFIFTSWQTSLFLWMADFNFSTDGKLIGDKYTTGNRLFSLFLRDGLLEFQDFFDWKKFWKMRIPSILFIFLKFFLQKILILDSMLELSAPDLLMARYWQALIVNIVIVSSIAFFSWFCNLMIPFS